jgi:hypothetical protein
MRPRTLGIEYTISSNSKVMKVYLNDFIVKLRGIISRVLGHLNSMIDYAMKR